MAEEASSKGPVGGCLALVVLFVMASCAFRGADETAEKVEAVAPVAQPVPAPVEEAAVPAPAPAPQPESKPKRVRYDELDEAEKTIRLVINLNGYLCAKPTQVAPTGSEGLYGVQCITHRSGSGIANYLVNVRTNDVTEI